MKINRNIFVKEAYTLYDSMTFSSEKLPEKNYNKHTCRHTIKWTMLEAVIDGHHSVIASQRGRRENERRREKPRESAQLKLQPCHSTSEPKPVSVCEWALERKCFTVPKAFIKGFTLLKYNERKSIIQMCTFAFSQF